MPPELLQPWKGFLTDLDGMIAADVALHCLGGFVVTACYGLPRPTGDLDVLLVLPSDSQKTLVNLAGKASELHKKHGVYLDVVTVATYPDNYEQRVVEVFPDACQHIRLFALDPYDLVLAKLERNLQRDRDDFTYLAQAVPLDVSILRQRYKEEMRAYLGRPEREDVTLQLWIDIVEERRNA
jgi:hypothetical protein